MLDWITEHPTTMSEATGAGVKQWSFFLKTVSWQPPLPGVESMGQSPAVRYRYVTPTTCNSRFFSSFLDECGRELGGLPGPSLDITTSEFVPPSQRDLYAHVAGFGTLRSDGSHLSTSTYAGLLRELAEVEDWGPRISGWLDPGHIASVTVPSKTSPGIRWKKLGYKTKKEALMPAIVEANRLFNRMLESGEGYSVPPAGVAGRGKRMDMNRKVDDETGKKDGRLIIMPDLVHHLIASVASSSYMSELKHKDKSEGGVLLGMGPFSDSYQQIAEWSRGASFYMFIDFSKFDQSIPSTVLRHTMRHISSRFDDDPGSDAYWESQFRHLVYTEIAMPDGCCYRKKRGVASGDPWTSLADSYANWIMLKHVMNVMGYKAKIWTFGDDSVVAIYDAQPRSDVLARTTAIARSSFGIDVSMKKSYVTRHLVDIDDDPEPQKSGSFLSMYFLQTEVGVRPTRPLQDMYEMMLVPERNREDVGWEVVRTAMAYVTFYYNSKARYVLEEYWDWLHRRHKVPELTGTYRDILLLQEMDLPWHAFKLEWLARLPRPGEIELMYKYGHTGFYVPVLWSNLYSRSDNDKLGNQLSFPVKES